MAGRLANRQPAYRVVVDGVDIGDRLAHRFSQLTLTEQRDGEADQLDLIVSDHDGRAPLPPEGAKVTVALGFQGEPLVDKGVFTVDDCEHAGAPDVVTLRARSADFTGDFRLRRDQSWKDKPLKEVLGEIAGRQGLALALAPSLADLTLPLVEQSRESDAALLRRLGKHFDAAATIKSGRLVFTPIGQALSAGGRALPPVTLTRAAGDQHRWSRPKREDHPGVTARWQDGGRRRTVTSGKSDGAKRLRRVYATEDEARQAADGAFKRVGRARATFDINLAYGRPDLYPERPVVLQGWKAEIDAAKWVIHQVTHSLGEAGFTTSLQLETVG